MSFVKKPSKNLHYIEDENVFKAVSFARKLHEKGRGWGLAISMAAKYYDISCKEISENLGKYGSAVRVGNNDFRRRSRKVTNELD